METGHISRALRLVPDIEGSPAPPHNLTTRIYGKYRNLIDVMRDQSGRSEADLPDWALVIRCLLAGNLHQALRWARLCEKERQASITDNDFTAYNLIRTELAEGNVEAARRIMDIRASRGNIHYLDDLFMSREEIETKKSASCMNRPTGTGMTS